MAATQTVPQSSSDDKSAVILIKPRHGVVTLSGYGTSVRVDRGHLVLDDGIAAARRHARFPRVNHGLRRLVVVGADGCVSLAALRWMASQNASFLMLDRDGSVLATTSPVRSSDPRLRRAQALAPHSGADVRIARALISSKLAGQARVARRSLNDFAAAKAILQARAALDTAVAIPDIRRLEARGGLAYWSAWRNVPVNFPSADLRRVPEHWRTFGSRISPVSGSPRCAANPVNAILNYLYAALEAESRLAAATVGLDPGLGFLHADSRSRDSLACDLMEPVRPEVDSYVLDWLTNRLLRRKDFFEMPDGTCRLMAGLCVQLSQTMRTWSHFVAPWAELVARTLWATVSKPGKPPATPLTGAHRRAGRVGEHARPAVVPPKPPKICRECGASCKKTFCPSCGRKYSKSEFDKGRSLAQTPESRARRSATQKERIRANRNWKPSKEYEWLDREAYVGKVQPHLTTVTIPSIQSALGVSEAYAMFVRSGSRVPHRRHWEALARLVQLIP